MATRRILITAAAALAAISSGCWQPTTAVGPAPTGDQLTENSLKNLESADPVERTFAAAYLGSQGAQAKEHLPALKKLLNDREPNVREAAKGAIQRIEKGG